MPAAALYQLLVEEHSRKQCDRIVNYIGRDKKRFADLMALFLQGEYRITQRAAWPLSYCVRQHPALIGRHLKPLLDNLTKEGIHVAVTRNTLRLLQDIEIPEKYQGQLMSACFDFLQSPDSPIAVKGFSLSVLQQLSRAHPDILAELRLITEEQWDRSTPAFRSRARRILKNVK